jgi:hypothetical protein
MNRAEKALSLREIGRAHKWGTYLYEVLRGGVVVAKISATPADAASMLAGMERAA